MCYIFVNIALHHQRLFYTTKKSCIEAMRTILETMVLQKEVKVNYFGLFLWSMSRKTDGSSEYMVSGEA